MKQPRLTIKQRFAVSRFLRGEAPSERPVTLGHRRIFILPTRRGLGVALLIVLLLTIAFVYNNNLVYLLAFLLSSVFFVGILHGYRALAGLVVQAGRSRPGFAGATVAYEIRLSNPHRQTRPSLQVTLADDRQTLALPGDDSDALWLSAPAVRRGWQTCGTVTVSSEYPLGWFRAWSPLRFTLAALVYPQPAAAAIALPDNDGSGDRRIGMHRSGDDYIGIKPYRAGDAVRRIHWQAYAKGQGLSSKQFGGESSVDVWLDYEVTPGHHREQRLSQLCRWLLDAEQAGLRYGLILPGRKLAIETGSNHQRRCLEALALF